MSFFDDSSNPFGDPSIRDATQSTQPATIDFNPFERQATAAVKLPPPPPPVVSNYAPTNFGQPAVASGSVMREEAPPSYAATPAEKVTKEELDRRQRELDAKAAEIQRREEQFARQVAAGGGRANNFPPLPECCPVKPCYYQDFDVDITDPFRFLVRAGYYITLGHGLVYFLTLVIGFAYFMVTVSDPDCKNAGMKCSYGGSTFGLSLLFFILFTPASYVCWFRPLYKAFKNDSSINFFWFFFVSLAQAIVDLIWALGIQGSGSLGFINGLDILQIDTGIGVTMLVVGCMSAVLCFFVCFLTLRVYRVYRTTGASFQKAKMELAHGAFSSDVMREAVASGVQSGMQSAVAGGPPSASAAGYSGSNPNRF